MKHAADMQHPLTDEFAEALYHRTAFDQVHELAGYKRTPPWETDQPFVREVFRERARRFMAGDLSVEAWRL